MFPAQRRFYLPQRNKVQGIRDKDRRQTRIEKGKGTREREGMFDPERQSTASGERGDRRGYRQMAAYKGKRATLC